MYIIIKKALRSSSRQSVRVQFWEAQTNLQAIAMKVWCWNHFVKYSYKVSEKTTLWLVIYSTLSAMHIYILYVSMAVSIQWTGFWTRLLILLYHLNCLWKHLQSTALQDQCEVRTASPALECITLKAQVHPSHCGIDKLKLLTTHRRKERATADHVGCPQSMQLKWVNTLFLYVSTHPFS